MTMLTIQEAAPKLGKTVDGMRKLVDRTKRAANGRHVNGATIRFAQDGPRGTIHFKPEWLDEYIDSITVGPSRSPAVRRKKPVAHLDWSELN